MTIRIMTWEELFGPIGGRRMVGGLKTAEWHTLLEHTMFDGYSYAEGSRYKFWTGPDHGWVVFHGESKTPDGRKPGKFIHRN